jgi:hypothetical protein
MRAAKKKKEKNKKKKTTSKKTARELFNSYSKRFGAGPKKMAEGGLVCRGDDLSKNKNRFKVV